MHTAYSSFFIIIDVFKLNFFWFGRQSQPQHLRRQQTLDVLKYSGMASCELRAHLNQAEKGASLAYLGLGEKQQAALVIALLFGLLSITSVIADHP